MIYAVAVCIALTTVALAAVAWLIVTRPQQPDAIVLGQQVGALKLSVTDLSERLDALYRRERTSAARAAKDAKPEPVQQTLELPARRSKAELRQIVRTKISPRG